jgi:hypothetical protein
MEIVNRRNRRIQSKKLVLFLFKIENIITRAPDKAINEDPKKLISVTRLTLNMQNRLI